MSHLYTDTMPDRCPEVFHNKDEPIPESIIPAGHYLHYGKLLPDTARAAKVPFGRAQKRTYVPGTTDSRIETVGLIIRLEDRERFTTALANKNAKKKRPVKSA